MCGRLQSGVWRWLGKTESPFKSPRLEGLVRSKPGCITGTGLACLVAVLGLITLILLVGIPLTRLAIRYMSGG